MSYLTKREYEKLHRNGIKHSGYRVQKENFGYTIVLVNTRSGVKIASGCRWFSFKQALEHWQNVLDTLENMDHICDFSWYTIRAKGMIELIPKLKKRAKSYGW